jgi:hypothetical protein
MAGRLSRVREVDRGLGTPRFGVTSTGDIAKTADPVPVSSVRNARRLALFGVARKVAPPVPMPASPASGRPAAIRQIDRRRHVPASPLSGTAPSAAA